MSNPNQSANDRAITRFETDPHRVLTKLFQTSTEIEIVTALLQVLKDRAEASCKDLYETN